jgi:hypothetical protein
MPSTDFPTCCLSSLVVPHKIRLCYIKESVTLCQCALLDPPVANAHSQQLCATGTVGIAAVGLALGHQKPATDHRPVSGKRKAPSRFTFDQQSSTPTPSTTTSSMAQPASAPTARLRKRNSFGRPLSSSSRLSFGNFTAPSIPDSKAEGDSGVTGNPVAPDTRTSFSHEPFDFEFNGNSTIRSSWFRRKSTMSMSNESPFSTPPPGSPSVSFSNGSTAPILPSSTNLNSSTLPRNKLVKRSTSQRALRGSSGMHSSLRRPATSHQRSATLQQQHLSDDERLSNNRSIFHPPSPLNDLREDQQADDDPPHIWQSFFKPQATKLPKDGSSRKRTAAGGISRIDTLKSIVPEADQLPTLMLATSIAPRLSADTANGRASHRQESHRLSTPVGFDTSIPFSTGQVQTEIYADPEPIPRKSFSFGGLFSSPSPSTWKPRSGSLKRNKTPSGTSSGRRIASAPHSTTPGYDRPSQAEPSSRSYRKTEYVGPDHRSHFSTERKAFGTESRVPSSPLPPLNRLSAFDIDLPGTAPSYLASPQAEQVPATPRSSNPPSPSASSPLGPLAFNTFRNKAHRPSGAPSDHASTLFGSDNENSRFLSGDEDDGLSETVYDSTRTGATGSSHSGVRRPPIDTVFDGSPPSEISKHKLLALQDLMSRDSFSEPPIQRADILEEEENVPTPGRHAAPGKEESLPVHPTSHKKSLSLSLPSSPPALPQSRTASKHDKINPQDIADDEVWSFDDMDGEIDLIKDTAASATDDDACLTQEGLSTPDLPYKYSTNAVDCSKPNIFDWSEHPSSEQDSLGSTSPRPKTVHGQHGKELRGSRLSGRRGPSPLHLRSQSVPVPSDGNGHRINGHTAKLESWVLKKGVSEDWDNDFEFDESPRPTKQASVSHDYSRISSSSTGMLVPRSILERQASVHGQFGQVKELTLLVEELKRLQEQATAQGIMEGQSAELWKEAEGIINLATVDDEDQEFPPPRSPRSPSFDFDAFDEDSPAGQSRRKSGISSSRGDRSSGAETVSSPQTPNQTPLQPSLEKLNLETPPPKSRPRKESAAKAKSVLENIHQQRSRHDLATLEQSPQKKLPFDTTSLRDLVTRAGVVTRALKEIVRRAENAPATPQTKPTTPPDPHYTRIFQQPPTSPSRQKSPRVTQSPKSGSFIGGNITGNDHDLNGHMKVMTVV